MKRIPFLLRPAAKDYLWGGSRLDDDFNLQLNILPLAEAWVCSCHQDGLSFALDTNVSLKEVLEKNPDYLGIHASSVADGLFPILIKLIDAKSDLSVQVHPNDDYALQCENSLGKTEMWYVLDARPGSELIYGFNQDVNAEIVKRALDKGEILHYLNHVPVHKGDLFFIEPGTVHAIGAGCLIAEIQESSNITYRLYDYNRVDKSGNKRELHINKALKVINMNSSLVPRQPMRVLKYRNGGASELLARCKYFQVERLLLNTEVSRELMLFRADSNSFHALLCVNGCGSISGDGFMLNFFKGDCVFVPADSEEMKLHGKAEMLDVRC